MPAANENAMFQSLYGALSARCQQVRTLRRVRQCLRYAGIGALVWLGATFIWLVSGVERFPNMLPLAPPAVIALVCGVVHAVVGYDLARASGIFRMIALDATPDYPAIEGVKAVLETDGTFDALRAEGFSLEQWRSPHEYDAALEAYGLWLTAADGHRLTAV